MSQRYRACAGIDVPAALRSMAFVPAVIDSDEGLFILQAREWLRGRWALGGLGALTVVLAAAFPGNPLHVQASPWLPLHWALGLSSYGMFAAAVLCPAGR